MALTGLQGGAHLGTGLDAGLLGDALLEGAEGQVGGDHAGFALAKDLEQVLVTQGVRVGQVAVAGVAQLDGDGVEVAGIDQVAHLVGALGADVGGAQQGKGGIADAEVPSGAASGLGPLGQRNVVDLAHGARGLENVKDRLSMNEEGRPNPGLPSS